MLMVLNMCAFTVSADDAEKYEIFDFEDAVKLNENLTAGEENVGYYGGASLGQIQDSVSGADGNVLYFKTNGKNQGLDLEFANAYSGEATLSFKYKAADFIDQFEITLYGKDASGEKKNIANIGYNAFAHSNVGSIYNHTTSSWGANNGVNIFDGEWHNIVFVLSANNKFTMSADGKAYSNLNPNFLGLGDYAANGLYGFKIGHSDGQSNRVFYIDDLTVTNAPDKMPGIAKAYAKGSSFAVSVNDGETAEYATGSTAAEATAALKTAAQTYSEPVAIDGETYVAVKAVKGGIAGAVKVYKVAPVKYEVYDFEDAPNVGVRIDASDVGMEYYGDDPAHPGYWGYITENKTADGNVLQFDTGDAMAGIRKMFANTYKGDTELSFYLGGNKPRQQIRIYYPDGTAMVNFYMVDNNMFRYHPTAGEAGGKWAKIPSGVDLFDGNMHKITFRFSEGSDYFKMYADGKECVKAGDGHEAFFATYDYAEKGIGGVGFGSNWPGASYSGMKTMFIDDITVTNNVSDMPGTVSAEVDGAQLTLTSTNSSDTIKYAFGASKAEARANLKTSAAVYTEPIKIEREVFVAAKPENSTGSIDGAVKTFTVVPKMYEVYDFENATKLNAYLKAGEEGIGYYGSGQYGQISDGVDGANGNVLKFTTSGQHLGIKKEFINNYTGTVVLSFNYKAATYIDQQRFELYGYDSDNKEISIANIGYDAYAAKGSIYNFATNAWGSNNGVNIFDGEWHKIEFKLFSNDKFTMTADGVEYKPADTGGNAKFLYLNGYAANSVKGIKIGNNSGGSGQVFYIDDLTVTSANLTMPGIVSLAQTDANITLTANEGDTIEYAVSGTAAGAKQLLASSPTAYTDTFAIVGFNRYIAARATSADGSLGAIKVYGPFGAGEMANLNKFYHLSPWNVVAAGGTETDDTLQLGLENGQITVTGTVENAGRIADATGANSPGYTVSVNGGDYIDINFTDEYTGDRTVNDLSLVFQSVNHLAAYDFGLSYKKSGSDTWTAFYADSLDDRTEYNQDNLNVYPTVRLTGFGDQVKDIDALRITFNANANGNPTVLTELDLNMTNDGFAGDREYKNSALKFARIYSDGMILQRDEKIKLWGYGGYADETVAVKILKGSEVVRSGKTTVDKNQQWSIELAPIAGSHDVYTVKVTDEDESLDTNEIVLNDVLFGDVFVASGQSNMELPLSYTVNELNKREEGKAEGARIVNEIAENQYSDVRFFKQSNRISALSELRDAYTGSWRKADSYDAIEGVSAVAYFFAKDLYEQLGKEIPIGILGAHVGGTGIAAWVPRTNPNLTDNQVSNNVASSMFSGFYNALITPLTSVNVKGVIWYQGETDSGNTKYYKAMYDTLQNSWREKWGDDLSFTAVQLSSYGNVSSWPGMREAQLQICLNDPTGGLAVTSDVGDSADIHPLYKAPVGKRLALSVANRLYGKDVEYSGPLFDSIRKDGNSLVLTFTHADGMAAMSRSARYTENFAADDAVRGFKISADGNTWTDAAAVISGNTITLTGVDNPKYVRYGYENVVDANLYNSAYLPAVPFRASISGTQAAPAVTAADGTATVKGSVASFEKLRDTLKMIIAKYDTNGALISTEIRDINTVLGEDTEFSAETADADGISVIILKDMETLRPMTAKGSK